MWLFRHPWWWPLQKDSEIIFSIFFTDTDVILTHCETLSELTSTATKLHYYSRHHLSLDTYVHDDVIKWKHFPRYWPFVRGIHRSPLNSPHKGQWRGTLMSSLVSARINGWVNNLEAGNLRRIRPHYDVTVMDVFKSKKLIYIYIYNGSVQANGH